MTSTVTSTGTSTVTSASAFSAGRDGLARAADRRRAVRRRAGAFGVALVVLLVVTGVVALSTGAFPVPVADVVRSLVGRGSSSVDVIVLDLRLPRLLCAVLAGAAFGASGAVFQNLTRNPLGSPDVIGFETGSASGALIVLIFLGGHAAQATLGAILGGLVTAVAVYLLALRGGGVSARRIVLMGIGVNMMLVAFNSYLIAHADFQDALAAQAWRIGNLANRDWPDVVAVAVPLALALLVALLLSRSLGMLGFGDDLATALGVRTERRRLELIAVAVVLAGAGTAAAGPVPFVALAAPQVAMRAARVQEPAIALSAVTGALLLALSDLVAQRACAPTLLPVGATTGLLGGLYLVFLLARSPAR